MNSLSGRRATSSPRASLRGEGNDRRSIGRWFLQSTLNIQPGTLNCLQIPRRLNPANRKHRTINIERRTSNGRPIQQSIDPPIQWSGLDGVSPHRRKNWMADSRQLIEKSSDRIFNAERPRSQEFKQSPHPPGVWLKNIQPRTRPGLCNVKVAALPPINHPQSTSHDSGIKLAVFGAGYDKASI